MRRSKETCWAWPHRSFRSSSTEPQTPNADLFAKIRETIAGIVDILGDMNALSPGQHQGASFEALIGALEARLAE
jgi:hypothetical protein